MTNQTMTKSDLLLAHVNKLLEKSDLSGSEKGAMKIAVKNIFKNRKDHKNHQDHEMLYYQLLDYLEENGQTGSLVTQVETYYQNIL